MAISTHISMITLNINVLNAPNKRQSGWMDSKTRSQGFLGGSVIKNLLTNAGDIGLILDPEGSHMPWTSKSVHHNYWSYALEPESCSYLSHVPHLLKSEHPRAYALQQETPLQQDAHLLQLDSSSHLPQWEKSLRCNEDSAQSKINK